MNKLEYASRQVSSIGKPQNTDLTILMGKSVADSTIFSIRLSIGHSVLLGLLGYFQSGFKRDSVYFSSLWMESLSLLS